MTQTRRRGAALEEAILDAGWDQLVEAGYPGFTFEAIADRARTGKAVLYRRWPDKEALLLAVLTERAGVGQPVELPDTGSLREDVLALLRLANRRLADRIPALVSALLGAYFDDFRTTPAQLRLRLLGDRGQAMAKIVQRAVDRGELPAGPPSRVIELPFDLLRHEALMNLGGLSDETLVEIVDAIFLPLARIYGN